MDTRARGHLCGEIIFDNINYLCVAIYHSYPGIISESFPTLSVVTHQVVVHELIAFSSRSL